jgi:hypothetical protein
MRREVGLLRQEACWKACLTMGGGVRNGEQEGRWAWNWLGRGREGEGGWEHGYPQDDASGLRSCSRYSKFSARQ